MKIKLLNDKAQVPTKATSLSAGYDLYACESQVVPKGCTCKIHTGIAIQCPHGYFGAIFARSGLATKHGLRPANCVGVVDEDYTGEVIVPLHNDLFEDKAVTEGDRVAQLILLPTQNIDFEVVESLERTQRNENGFGSTGK